MEKEKGSAARSKKGFILERIFHPFFRGRGEGIRQKEKRGAFGFLINEPHLRDVTYEKGSIEEKKKKENHGFQLERGGERTFWHRG